MNICLRTEYNRLLQSFKIIIELDRNLILYMFQLYREAYIYNEIKYFIMIIYKNIKRNIS